MTGSVDTAHQSRESLSGARADETRALLGERVTKRLDELTDAMLAGYGQEIAAYRALDDPDLREDVRAVTRMHLEVLIDIVVGGTATLEESHVAALRSFGARRAEHGFPLHAVLRAYQVGTRIVWEGILAELAEIASDAWVIVTVSGAITTAILDVTARISEEVSQSFVEAQERAATGEERTRRALFENLLRGLIDDDVAAGRQAAEAGYRLGKAHVVVAACATAPGSDESPGPGLGPSSLERALIAALGEVRPIGAAPIVDKLAGVVLAIVVADDRVLLGGVVDQVRSAIAGVRLPAGAQLRACVGNVIHGVSGIAQSYRQASQALRALVGLGREEPVATYTDMLPYLLLGADLSLATDLYRASVAPLFDLGSATSGTNELVQTLEAYLEAQGNLGRAAERLFVHRHTVTARLARIERLTGVDLTDSRGMFNLELGLFAWEVLTSGGLAPPADPGAASGGLAPLSSFALETFDKASLGVGEPRS
jgi:hypothetical protein